MRDAARFRQVCKYNFKSLSVLIVWDNEFLSKIIDRICRAFGFGDVRSVDSVDAAIRVLNSAPIDFVISGWEMKPVDGIDLVRRIRSSNGECRFVPTMILSGHTQASEVKRARDAGVTEIVVVPVSPQTLLDRLVHTIECPRPFISNEHYNGPDRRRHKTEYNGPERRATSVASDGGK